MDHQIKLARVRKLADTGRYPATYDAMLDHVPAVMVERLSAADIAHVIDAMWAACREAKGLADRDVCAEGAVWDSRRGCLRDLAA